MGCDIHIVAERRRKSDGGDAAAEGWIGVYCTDFMPKKPAFAGRDYDFFAQVANVRGSGKEYPRNLPRDVSALAWHRYMDCSRDYHSVSHMPLKEFIAIWRGVNPANTESDWQLAGIEDEEGYYECRVVFWFDN